MKKDGAGLLLFLNHYCRHISLLGIHTHTHRYNIFIYISLDRFKCILGTIGRHANCIQLYHHENQVASSGAQISLPCAGWVVTTHHLGNQTWQ